jgi:purine-nucleoside phosphorylase
MTGDSWTTDAPFRKTEHAIAQARDRGILAVEMEAAALYAFVEAKQAKVLCIAHVTNTMGPASRTSRRAKRIVLRMRFV